ncbi:MAG: type II toxin-antitoxin system Phd/YefM family antitoxin [Ruminococcaceae bacterium]|nr:type II toxin-antitoxin system Phd/YefM family antitoxin [Oscillospiraceae bacterium]
MLNTNVTNFRKNLFELMEQTIRYNEPINVSTKSGNAVVLSEEDYNGMIETLNLLSDPIMRKKLIAGRDTALDECVGEDEVEW